MNSTHIFVQSPFLCIDEVRPDTGRSRICNKTLEQIQAEYPGAEVVAWEPWLQNKEKALCTEAERITEETFIEMLEVLPPDNWQRQKGAQSFELCEHTSGRVTAIYCCFGGRYYAFQGIAGQSLAANAAHCKEQI